MRQAEKQRKKFQSRIPLILDLGKKIPKKIAKEFKKLKHLFLVFFFSQNRMRYIEKERKKIFKKLEKTPFRHNFQAKRDEIYREREKKILVPNSVHTRPGQENSKKNSKKIQKIKKPLSGNIFRQNGIRQAKKKKKNFRPEFRSYSTRARKFRRKQQKNSKITKNLFPALFLAKTG